MAVVGFRFRIGRELVGAGGIVLAMLLLSFLIVFGMFGRRPHRWWVGRGVW